MSGLFSRNNIWKILPVGLLLYVFTIGLLTPLKPGLLGVQPEFAEAGETKSFTISGYNSQWTADKSLEVFLKLDSLYYLSAKQVEVTSPTTAELQIAFPDTFPEREDNSAFFSLIVLSEGDAPMVLPDAIRVKPESIAYGPSPSGWRSAIEVLPTAGDFTFPYRNILAETIRNLFFHVPLWFGMILILLGSVIYSIRYLRTGEIGDDLAAKSFAEIGVLYGVLGLLTGALWAKFTWGAYWNWDIKQTMSAIALLIYFAYFILRSSVEDAGQRGKLSSVYNIFAFAALIPLLFIIPRLASVGVSLHPGNGGNPGFSSYDLDATMRMVFYPAVIGWTLFGLWLARVRTRFERLQERWRSQLY